MYKYTHIKFDLVHQENGRICVFVFAISSIPEKGERYMYLFQIDGAENFSHGVYVYRIHDALPKTKECAYI